MATFYAGQRLTASLLQGAVGVKAGKGADTARSSANTGTTLTADPDLTVTLAANSVYLVSLMLLYKGGTTGSSDFKFAWSLPAGASLAGEYMGIANPIGLISATITGASVTVSYTNGTGTPFDVTIEATVTTSSTAGNLTLTWAQNTSSATSTTLMAGSSLRAALK